MSIHAAQYSFYKCFHLVGRSMLGNGYFLRRIFWSFYLGWFNFHLAYFFGENPPSSFCIKREIIGNINIPNELMVNFFWLHFGYTKNLDCIQWYFQWVVVIKGKVSGHEFSDQHLIKDWPSRMMKFGPGIASIYDVSLLTSYEIPKFNYGPCGIEWSIIQAMSISWEKLVVCNVYFTLVSFIINFQLFRISMKMEWVNLQYWNPSRFLQNFFWK